ncbi:potassium channel protein [Merismopedia glauca CCAP 1448/3]|uniref:Potassium channel protein n=1 Tax=Merismopedia glauca CCAP 1448/3 TaxID=1296344 RepID=A0A2T1C6K5_9CYAN|nr:potassium channel protein [Merismopedia glauca CCAP 1448/3]
MKPKIIVCGLGDTGLKIFSLLQQQGANVVGIHHQVSPDNPPKVVIGDLRDAATLGAAGILEADTLVLTANDDALNLAIVTQARVLNPKIRIVNRLFNQSLGDRLDCTLPHHTTMSVAALAAPVFAFAAQGSRAIGQLQLFNQTWPLQEEYIHEQHPWLNRLVRELWDDRTRMLIYYLPVDEQMDLISAIEAGKELQVGDRLIVATLPNIRHHRQSWGEKFWKIIASWQHLQRHGQPVAFITVALIITIVTATFIYACFDLNTSPIDALYFAVGTITGAGGDELVSSQTPDSMKIFTVVLMLVGAGVIGIFYALLTDFVLGTRFRQFWDSARIPQRDHYIICGLGGLGVQIVRQLHQQGLDVVVIERDLHNRFLHAVRAENIPVILGDASLSTTLEAAGAANAEALVAVTSDDISNLEIALSTKSLAPKLATIVRLQEPSFAQTVQQVFEFEAVLSPTELAAPSFAAAALGEKILGNGMTGNTLWVALATLITPGHPFCGQRVKQSAMAADFVPLYIETNCQTLHGWDILETCLSAGDVLYLTIPAHKLDALWRGISSTALIIKETTSHSV